MAVSLSLIGCRHPPPVTKLRDLPYRSDPAPRHTGDLYLPAGPGPFPVALVLHGGGWSGRDRSDTSDIAAHLASQGIAAFNINYRLAPEHRFPAQLEDAQAALRWIAAESVPRNLDLDRLYTVGYSAGAHLALLAATSQEGGVPPVRAVIAGGPPTDLTRYPESPYVRDLLGTSIEENPALFRQASPLLQVTPQHPPVFLYHGRLDRIVAYKNSILLRDALLKADVPVELHTRLLEGHILSYFREKSSLRRAIRFLESLETP